MAQDLHAHAVFVRRVLTHLVRANLVQAREGRDGGYRLARSAEQMTLAEVYQAVRLAGQSKDMASNPGVNARFQATLAEIEAQPQQRPLAVTGPYTLPSALEAVAF